MIEAFPDWKNIFDYYEKEAAEGKLDKVREFVCALQCPYNYLLTRKADSQCSDFMYTIISPLHVEAYRGHHKLIHMLLQFHGCNYSY